MQIIGQLTEENFEQLLPHLLNSSRVDLQDLSFIDSYGMVGLLELGDALKSNATPKILSLPTSTEVIRYLERMEFVNQWNGKISIRSGTAKSCILPHWARGKEKESPLPYFPGAQISLLLPEV